jgi:hypothetical protein
MNTNAPNQKPDPEDVQVMTFKTLFIGGLAVMILGGLLWTPLSRVGGWIGVASWVFLAGAVIYNKGRKKGREDHRE